MSRIMQNHAQANRPFCGRTWPWLANQQDVELNTSWGFSEDSMFILSTLVNTVHTFSAPICRLVYCLPALSHTLAITSKKPWYGIAPLSSALMSSSCRTRAGHQFLQGHHVTQNISKSFLDECRITRTCSSHASFTLQPLASRYCMFLVVLCSQYLFNFNRCAKSPMWFCGNYRPKWCSWGKFTLPLGLSFLRLPSTFSSLHLPRSSRSKTLASHVITRYNSTSCTKHEAPKRAPKCEADSNSLTILCRFTSFMSSYMTYGRAMLCCHVVQYLAIPYCHQSFSNRFFLSVSDELRKLSRKDALDMENAMISKSHPHGHSDIPKLDQESNETKCTNAIFIRTLLEGQDDNLILYWLNIMTTIAHYTALDPY